MLRWPFTVLLVLAFAGCVGQRVVAKADYTRLVHLRGETTTLLLSGAISRQEARWLEDKLDEARADVDSGDLNGAKLLLDGVTVYIGSREGKAL